MSDMGAVPQSHAVVRREHDCAVERWTTHSGDDLTWRTLITGDRDGTRAMTVGVTEVPAAAEVLTTHRHAADEVYVIQAGEGVMVIDEVAHELRTGTAVFIPGGSWHSVRNTGAEPLRILYVFPTDNFSDVVYEFPPGSVAPAITDPAGP